MFLVNSLLFFFCFFLLFVAFMVISVKNPIHSILYLILVFVSASALLLILNIDFLAMIFIVVYVGAIAVLFLFVVMLLNIKIIEKNLAFVQYVPLSLFILAILVFEVVFFFDNSTFQQIDLIFKSFYEVNSYISWAGVFFNVSNIEAIGEVLYTYFFQYFLITSFILLVAMIGPIVLTLNKTRFSLKQNIYEQNLRS